MEELLKVMGQLLIILSISLFFNITLCIINIKMILGDNQREKKWLKIVERQAEEIVKLQRSC